jgi:DNA primase
VYFCFDGDAAGRKAAWKALESVIPRMKDGRQAFFLFLPDGEDPDTIVRKEGAEAFDARLKQGTPLSQFFFDELSREINLGTLDGKARLAERAKPMLAQIPDGAFGDLMKQELARLTGIGNTSSAAAAPAPRPPMRNNAVPAQKRSLVRAAIAILLQQPSLVMTLEGHHAIGGLRLPGIELLVELMALVQQRPDISTGALLEHFNDREEQAALHKLAAQALPGDEALWAQELQDAVMQLEKQLLTQRLDELQAKQRQQGLDETDKYELRELLKARASLRL